MELMNFDGLTRPVRKVKRADLKAWAEGFLWIKGGELVSRFDIESVVVLSSGFSFDEDLVLIKAVDCEEHEIEVVAYGHELFKEVA